MSAADNKQPQIPRWKLHVLFAVGAMLGLSLLPRINGEPTTLSYT